VTNLKPIKLSTICKELKITQPYVDVVFKHIDNHIKYINHDTLVFHMNRGTELNINKFEKLENCFIITDQPLINKYNHIKQRFLFVQDVEQAYRQIITYYRYLFDIPVVAITGTCGKTTTKEMIKQILEKKFNVVSTILNRNSLVCNNDYLFSIDDYTDYGVFETAVAAPGYLLAGCDYFKPTIGVITNIGIDHLSECKTLDNYIRAKGEMLAGLQYKGTLIINNDDENINQIDLSPYKGKIITFGIKDKADFYADEIEFNDSGMNFTLHHGGKRYSAYVPGLGNHSIYNALAAVAVLSELKFDLSEILEHLSHVKLIRSHLEVHKAYNGSTIIDDTWSSNPTSMKAALEVLGEKGKAKIKVAVLGKILYLGDYADAQYKEIGKMIHDYNIDYLITTDSSSKLIADYAIDYGLSSKNHIHCNDNHELKETLEKLLNKATMALFKVSMYNQRITDVMKDLIRAR
jgi:UDP-N-acetylmuramoyl-tripeptide--D-alanyl-D-alanine ligase